MDAALSASVVADLQRAAALLTGAARRRFQAEMTLKHAGGRARRAESVFGWGRAGVETGLGELRTGVLCLENHAARGRIAGEQADPALAARLRAAADPEAQAEPRLRTALAYTRATAKAVRARLAETTPPGQALPAERTVNDMLNRLGFRLRRVAKTVPKKSCRRPTRSSPA
jgi:hypothetical protein